MLDQTPYTPDIVPPLFALNGLCTGPRLVVAGPEGLIRAVCDLLWDRRDLANLHGSLILRVHGPDLAFDLPDHTLDLTGEVETARLALGRMLDHMATLGMVPTRSFGILDAPEYFTLDMAV